MLPVQGARVRFLLGELRSHMPHSAAKKEIFFFKLKNQNLVQMALGGEE